MVGYCFRKILLIWEQGFVIKPICMKRQNRTFVIFLAVHLNDSEAYLSHTLIYVKLFYLKLPSTLRNGLGCMLRQETADLIYLERTVLYQYFSPVRTSMWAVSL